MSEDSPALAAAKAPPKPAPLPWERPAGKKDVAPPLVLANELFKMEFPPPQFVVDGLIGDGLTMLCGKPKQGKSWLSLMIAWAVASNNAIDGRKTREGMNHVLYLALEDTKPRVQSRMKMLHKELGWTVPETLHIATHWPRDGDQMGLVFIGEWLALHKGRLVIVDTLAKFRKPSKNNANAYAEDYEATSNLKDMVDFYKASAMYVHHTRKQRSEDPFDEISGSYGISGSADTLIVLENEGGSGKLYIRGRDIAESTVPIQFTPASGRWVLGATKDGLDTEGRMMPTEGGKKTATEACAEWLKRFLATEAYPSKEIEWAAKAAGFSDSALRNAKASLGNKGTREILNKNISVTEHPEWWSGPMVASIYNWNRRKNPIANPNEPKAAAESAESAESGTLFGSENPIPQ